MPTPSRTPWNTLVESLLDAWPPHRWANIGVMIGCSGGADSVALVKLLHQVSSQEPAQNGFLVLGHFDHGLRANESRGDADFVEQLARDLGIQSQRGTGDGERSDEAHLRQQRYDFFRDAAAQTGCRYIALAHSLDDNVETVLHHLMRGTGPAGLAGIAPSRPAGSDSMANDFVITRPLLGVRRQLIRDGLREIGQDWREDSSNTNTDYQRNWIRSELLPLMSERFPEAVPAIGRAIESQREWREIIDGLANDWIAQNVLLDSSTTLTIRRSADHQSSVTIAALQILWQDHGWSRTAMVQRHWQQLVATLQADDEQRYSLPGDRDVVASGPTVQISPSGRSVF